MRIRPLVLLRRFLFAVADAFPFKMVDHVHGFFGVSFGIHGHAPLITRTLVIGYDSGAGHRVLARAHGLP